MVEPPDSESPAARLVGELLDEGEVVDDGQFSLDPEAAAAKFEVFAYADRSLYLVPLIEGLLGLGARAIGLETVGEDLSIRALGVRLHEPRTSFEELYAHALGHGDDPLGRALGRLAIGFDMILGSPATERVKLSYSSATQMTVGEYRRRAAPQLSVADPEVIAELKILIDHPWISLSGSNNRAEALEHLRAAVRFSDHEISLDGARLTSPRRPWFARSDGEGPGYCFRAGLEESGEPASVIELWASGICVERLQAEGLAFTAVIELDAPRRDLSQLQFVRDETLERALAQVEGARLEAYRQLEVADERWRESESERPSAWPSEWVARVLGSSERDPTRRPLVLREAKLERREPLGPVGLIGKSRVNAIRDGLSMTLGALCLVAATTMFLTALGPFLEGVAFATHVMLWALGCLGAGALAFSPAVHSARRIPQIRELGQRTHATVTKIQEVDIVNSHVLWSFEDALGNQHDGRSFRRTAREAKLWVPGETIVIYYDPERPEECYWEADIGPRTARLGAGAPAPLALEAADDD